MSNIPEISVQPEQVASIGSFVISNAMVSTLAATVLLIVFVLIVKSKISMVPGRLQVACEGIVSFFYDKLLETYKSKELAKKHAALIIGLFVFIFICNQFTLIPLVQSIVVDGGVSLFRSPTSHFSLTIAMALVVVVLSHLIALSRGPFKHLFNYIKVGEIIKIRSFKDIPNAMLEIFLGVLDIIGELAKIISLSARLFGNVFAGEVMVAVISGLSAYTQFVVPAPFYVLSVFSGLIQAMVFAMLSMAFVAGLAKPVEE